MANAALKNQPVPTSIQIPEDLMLVFPEIACMGGAKSETEKIREDHEGNRLETETKVIRTVADLDEYETGKSLARSALRKIERVATRTPIGLTCKGSDLAKIDAGLAEILPQIESYNRTAVHSRITASYFTIPVGVQMGPAVAKKMADHVRVIFERIRDAILTDTDKLHGAMVAAENVAELSTGIQRESALLAFQQARENQREIRGRVKRGVSPATAGNDLPVDMIENAIALFTY